MAIYVRSYLIIAQLLLLTKLQKLQWYPLFMKPLSKVKRLSFAVKLLEYQLRSLPGKD